MTEDPGGGIVARLVRVLGALDDIPKNGTAPANQGGYAFRRVEDVTAALKPLFVEHGVLSTPEVIERLESSRPTKSGGTLFVVDLHIRWTFRSVFGETLNASMWGEGSDSGDKATQKAVTASLKSLLTPTMLISDSSDDAEAHDTPESAPQPPPPERKPLDGWDSVEDMDAKHIAFQTGVAGLNDAQRAEVAAFRAAQKIPWPMTAPQMETMLEQVKRITSFDAAQGAGKEAADGPAGQDVTPGAT